jgi:AraC-like DNA-binding protein
LPERAKDAMIHAPTSLSSWGLAIRSALEARGIDGAGLFQRAGLDAGALADPLARYPLAATTRLWRLAIDATGDPAFGIEVARHARPTNFNALGFSLAASGSLVEAFERIVRYFRLVSDAAEMTLEAFDESYRFTVELVDPEQRPADEAVDAFVALAVRVCRVLRDRSYNPLSASLRRPAPPDETPFRRYFRVPVVFGAPADVLVFDKSSFEARLASGNAELARLNDQVLVSHLARLGVDRFTSKLELFLVEALPHGEPNEADAAARLGTSVRNLQRRLADESTTYKEVLDETRRKLARSYLGEARCSISEIAYLLGFGAASSFTRAFRRWEGVSPSEFQAKASRV